MPKRIATDSYEEKELKRMMRMQRMATKRMKRMETELKSIKNKLIKENKRLNTENDMLKTENKSLKAENTLIKKKKAKAKGKAKKKSPAPAAAPVAASSPSPAPVPAVVSSAPVQAPQVQVDTQGQVADSATDEEASRGAPVEFDYGDNFVLDHSLSSHLVALGFDKEEHRTMLANILGDNVAYFATCKVEEVSKRLEFEAKNLKTNDYSFLNILQIQAVISLFHFVDDQRRQGLPLTGAGMTAEEFRLQADAARKRADIHKDNAKAQNAMADNLERIKFNGNFCFAEFKKHCLKWHRLRKGLDQVPLTYLLRDHILEECSDDATYEERIIAHASLDPNNFIYRWDARASHRFIWEAVKGTEAKTWLEFVRKHQDGRKDWLQILKFYDFH